MSKYLDKIDQCNKIPSKGGIPFEEVKALAKEMGIDVKGKTKDQLCDAMKALVTSTSDTSSTNSVIPNESIKGPIGPIGPKEPGESVPGPTAKVQTKFKIKVLSKTPNKPDESSSASEKPQSDIGPGLDSFLNGDGVDDPDQLIPKKFKVKSVKVATSDTTKSDTKTQTQTQQPKSKPDIDPINPSSPILIRIGQRQMRKSYPSAVNFLQIPAWSGGKGIYRNLSPFYLGPITYDNNTALTFENFWQFMKVYKSQVDDKGEPTQAYYNWRNKGFASDTAERHPMGKDIPLYSFYNGEKLGVVDARKKIYIPYYKELVRKTAAYQDLLKRLKAGQPLLLIEPDGPSLADFPQGMPFTRELFTKLIPITDQRSFFTLVNQPYPYPGNRYFPLGHGYVLADALLEDLGY